MTPEEMAALYEAAGGNPFLVEEALASTRMSRDAEGETHSMDSSTDPTHSLSAPHQLRYPGGKNGMWQVDCTCKYRTGPYATPEAAMKPAQAHLEAVT